MSEDLPRVLTVSLGPGQYAELPFKSNNDGDPVCTLEDAIRFLNMLRDTFMASEKILAGVLESRSLSDFRTKLGARFLQEPRSHTDGLSPDGWGNYQDIFNAPELAQLARELLGPADIEGLRAKFLPDEQSFFKLFFELRLFLVKVRVKLLLEKILGEIPTSSHVGMPEVISKNLKDAARHAGIL